MRPYITQGLAILIVVGAFFGAKQIIASKKKIEKKSVTSIPTAIVQSAKNKIVPVSITESGRIVAKQRIDLYAEVQGVMEVTSKEFKPGARFKKGEVLVKIKNDDYIANLQAQKSVLQNLITSILPDMKLDFPKAYSKWDTYLKEFDMNKPVPVLPEPESEKEKFFLTGKNIYTTYYNTKNLEIILKKYTLRAPYNGVLTEALVTPGTLIRNGQKLGEFIRPTAYELELSVSKDLVGLVSVGKLVTVTNPENPSELWKGKVSRINGKVNPTTQTVRIYVDLKGSDLKEGMYLEAQIAGQEKLNAIELPRNLLVDDTKLFVVVNDSILQLAAINVLHKSKSSVIVQGIEDGVSIVIQPIPGGYSGMKVASKLQE